MDRSACALLRQIYCGGRLTRRDLAARTGLSVPRVSAHVAQMVQLGLVTEEPCQSGLGRPACLLSPASHLARAVGLDLGNGQCQAVLLDAAGQVLASKTRLAPGAPASCRTMIDDVPDLVRSVCSQVGQDPAGLAAVGIGLPGIVDAQSGMVLAWPNTPDQGAWLGTNVRAALADRLHPALVVLEDFVRALALAAHRFGPARGKAHVLYAYLGDSIGSALIIDGQLYRGETDIMGEIGHISVDRSGPPCRCGNNGCLEMLASTPAVLRRVEQRLRHGTVESMLRGPVESGALTLSTLLQAAQAGDKLAYQVLDETGAMIGRVLATAVNLFGPGQVVLGGPLAQSGGILLEAALRQIRLEALQYISRQVQLVCDDSDALAGARGAAIRALDTLFASDERLQALLARRHRSA